MNLRHRPRAAAPPGVPPRCVELAERARQALEIVALALEDDGAAQTALEAEARRAALLPLGPRGPAGAGRRRVARGLAAGLTRLRPAGGRRPAPRAHQDCPTTPTRPGGEPCSPGWTTPPVSTTTPRASSIGHPEGLTRRQHVAREGLPPVTRPAPHVAGLAVEVAPAGQQDAEGGMDEGLRVDQRAGAARVGTQRPRAIGQHPGVAQGGREVLVGHLVPAVDQELPVVRRPPSPRASGPGTGPVSDIRVQSRPSHAQVSSRIAPGSAPAPLPPKSTTLLLVGSQASEAAARAPGAPPADRRQAAPSHSHVSSETPCASSPP